MNLMSRDYELKVVSIFTCVGLSYMYVISS